MLSQILRFVGIGGLATLAHVLTALVVQATLPVTAQTANLAGFAGGVVVSYAGHARVTFGAPVASLPQMLRFLVLSLTGLAASSLTVWVVTVAVGASFAVAMVAVALIVPAFSFVAMRLWVFADLRPLALRWEPLVSAALALVLLAVAWNRLVNHDIAWYLFAARDWLNGARLYLDLVEVNPPLNFYLTVPALLWADLLGIGDQNGHYVNVALMLFGSLCWAGAILRRHFALTPGRRAALLCGIALAVTVPTLDGIGQREQVMVLAFLPWALYLAAGHDHPASAALAAIGMCLKPHFVALPLAVTLLNCAKERSLHPARSRSNLVFLVVGLAYMAFVGLVHPAYYTDILGLTLEVYGAFRVSALQLLQIIGYPLGLFALILLAALRSRQLDRPVAVFATLAGGGLLSYALQGTGFAYHKMPFLAFAMAAGWLLLARGRRSDIGLVPALIGAAGLVVTGLHQGFYRNTFAPVVAETVSGERPIASMITLTTNMYSGPAVAMALGADWASSYPSNWLVPGAINRLAETDCVKDPETCARLTEIAARNRTANLTDIARLRPDLLIVDQRSEHFATGSFDWLAFMAQDPAWAAILADYRQMARSLRFLYFLRRD